MFLTRVIGLVLLVLGGYVISGSADSVGGTGDRGPLAGDALRARTTHDQPSGRADAKATIDVSQIGPPPEAAEVLARATNVENELQNEPTQEEVISRTATVANEVADQPVQSEVASRPATVMNETTSEPTASEVVSRSATVWNVVELQPVLGEVISRSATVTNEVELQPTLSEVVSRSATVVNDVMVEPNVNEVVSRSATVMNGIRFDVVIDEVVSRAVTIAAPEQEDLVVQVHAITNCGLSDSTGLALALTAGDWRVTVHDNANNYYDAYTVWTDRHLWFWNINITIPGSEPILQWAPVAGYWPTQQGALAANVGGSTTIHLNSDSTVRFWIRDSPCWDNYGGVTVLVEPDLSPRPNLVVSDPGGPQQACVGEAIDVSWTVTNYGDAPATGLWEDCVFLSDDDQFGDDAVLGCFDRPDELNATEWYEQLVKLEIPYVEEGEYWLFTRGDSGDVLHESDETDNVTAYGPIQVDLPNLAVLDALDPLPTEGSTGRPITVGWTVTNTGDCTTAGTWTDCVFLSDDNAVGDDHLLGCMPKPIGLSLGEGYDRVGTFTVTGIPGGDYWIIVTTDNDDTLAEADETDNITVAGPIPIFVVPCADLVPSNLQVGPASVPAGGTAYAEWLVSNIGAGPTNAPFWVDRIYLSSDQTQNGIVAQAVPDFPNPMALSPSGEHGDAYWQDVAFDVPRGIVGDYFLIVETNALRGLEECDFDNNYVVSNTKIRIDPEPPTPVLVMTGCAVDPTNPSPGDSITVTWHITNTGQVSTGPFTIDHALVLSTDDILSPGSDTVLAWHVGEYSGNLAPGETTTGFSATANIPHDFWGPYSIIIWPDPPLSVDLDRSPCARPITVETPFPSDLVVDRVTAPSVALSGQPIDVRWEARNAANAPSHATWWDDEVYLSRDNDFSTTGDNLSLGTFRHNGILNFDETYTGPEQGSIVLPNETEGAYFVFVEVDATNRVYEGGLEPNIGSAGPIEVTYAPSDLVVHAVAVLDGGVYADSVLSGDTVRVEWAVSNIGIGATPVGSWSDRIYVSADDVLDGNDSRLATVRQSGVLDVGQSYARTRTVTIPRTFSSAGAYIFVQTDYAGQVFEADDDNNEGVSDPFEVMWAPADLIVPSVTVETGGAPVVSGSMVTVEWTVVNEYLGTTSTSSWSDRIYISLDGAFDGSDRALASVGHTGVLAPNESYSASRDVKIPIDFVGLDVYILVKADHGDSVYESDNGNNVGVAARIEVAWGPSDLRVDSISAAGGAVAGEPLSLNWTVRNVGGPTATDPWLDRVYLSIDRWLSGDDVVFEPPVEPPATNLEYNATYTASATVDLPVNLSDRFYLIVETDINDVVPESDEGNNTRNASISLTPLPVDLLMTSVDAPEAAISGQGLPLAWTVNNIAIGATPTGAWRDAVYLSPDQYLDPGFDHYLGYFDHSGILNPSGEPGDSYTSTGLPRTPGGLSGPYYVFVCTDINNHVHESADGGGAEANNCEFDPVAVQLQIPPPVDLVVTDIVVPAPAMLGEDVTIGWTVQNVGDFDAEGSWHDAVYVSSDTTWDIGDKWIGEVRHAGPLTWDDPAGYTESLTAQLPGVVPGNYHVIVRTNVRNEARESTDGETNNTTPSTEPFIVSSWELALGASDATHLLATGTEHYFRIPSVPGGEDLLISLDCSDDLASTELYVRHGAVPDRGHYDFAYETPFVADHEIVVPGTKAGDYYLLVRGDRVPGGPSGYRIANRLLEFEIRGITPANGGNAGTVTANIKGSRLSPDTVARLVAGETVIEGVTWPLTTPTRMFVSFDLRGAAAGVYDVELVKPDEASSARSGEAPVALPGSFEVVAGTGPSLQVHLVAPSTLRVNRPFVVHIAYGNTGDADLPAPLLSLSAPEGIPLRLDPAEDPWPGPVQVLAVAMEGPPGVLRPGMWQSIPVYSHSPASAGALELSLDMMVADATPIDWNELEIALRPEGIPDELWAAIWANMTNTIGSTWADVLAVLTESATYLASVGERTYDVRELLGVVARSASGDLGLRLPLAVRVDGFSPAPGLPLVFAPVALNNLAQRFHVGPLGRGWSHNFEYSLSLQDEDNIIVSVPGGFARPFTKQPDGSWQGSPGDYGRLEDLDGDTYQIIEKTGLVWLFGPSGHLAYVEEPNGNRVTLSYSEDDLVDITHSNGHRFTIAYNEEGRIVSLTDHVARVTQYEYDGTGDHLTRVVAPGNRVTAYAYNAAAGDAADYALSTITFADGTHRNYRYDAQGRLFEVSRNAGAEQYTLTYDEFGTIRIAGADGNVSILRLGSEGQLVHVQDALGNTVSLDYDETFNLVRLTAPDCTIYELGHDDLGNLTESVDPLGAIITLGHTPDLSRLDWLRDSRDNLMNFNSDGRGNLTEIVHPDTSREVFDYDGRGEIVTVTNRRGQSINYWHDAAGRIIRKEGSDGRRTRYEYDARGNLVSVIDSETGTIAMEYDDRDFLSRIEYPGGIWFTFEYNDAGWRTRRTGHDGFVLNYYYDVAGRLERLSDGEAAEIIRYEYDSVGRLSRENKGNETYTTYEYDAVGQVLHLVNYAPDGTVQSRFDYTYDVNGNPTSMDTLEGRWLYGYDAIGQLTHVTYPSGQQVVYEYDLAGNRVRVIDDGVPTEYVTNELNQYAQVGNVIYTYDADGNMTSKTDDSGTTIYAYDVENRLIGVDTPADGVSEYIYDGLGNRVAAVKDGVAVQYAHDPVGLTDVAAEYSSMGTLVARYVHGLGLAARIDATEATAYYAFDGTGHTRQLTNKGAAIIRQYSYEPFGRSLVGSGNDPNPFQFVGRYGVIRDQTDFMRARFYDTSLGRFLTADPLGVVGGWNLYMYVRNRPTISIDPLGLKGWSLNYIQIFIEELWDNLFNPDFDLDKAINRADARFKVEISGDMGSAVISMGVGGAVESVGRVAGPLAGAAIALEPTVVPFLLPDNPSRRPEHTEFGRGPADYYEVPADQLDEVDSDVIDITAPIDPNEKLSRAGFADRRMVPVGEFIPYRVNFENLPDATAPAQQVVVTDRLSPHLDWRTFQLDEIAFGDTVVEVPEHRARFVDEVQFDDGLIVEIEAGLDIDTLTATWTMTAIDPETGEQPEDPLVGLLPPNDPELHDGEGYVTFTVRPWPDLTTGTEITNSATIIFDTNEPIETNEVFNTIDAVAPGSAVTGPVGEQAGASFDVTWGGHDDEDGSGVVSYSIYYRAAGEPYAQWLTTSDTSARFTAAHGNGQFDFYSLATDGAGNTEAPPAMPDTTVSIYPAVPQAPAMGLATAVTVQINDLGNVNAASVEHAVFEDSTQRWVGQNRRLVGEPFWQPLEMWRGFQVRALEPSTEYRFAARARDPETDFGPPSLGATSVQGDVNGDGLVTQADTNIVQRALGSRYDDRGFDARADVNGDDKVTYADLGIVNLERVHNGDYTGDGRVAFDDIPMFVCCMNGPDGTPRDGACGVDCGRGDVNLDNDLDLADFAAIQRVFVSD